MTEECLSILFQFSYEKVNVTYRPCICIILNNSPNQLPDGKDKMPKQRLITQPI